MRVYLPSTVSGLRHLLVTGSVGDPPLPAFAVTGALREWYAEGGDDELEYAALSLAARASLRLLDADRSAPPRRVVLAAEVPDGSVVPAPAVDRGAVHVGVAVERRAIQAIHLDDPSAQDDVRAAVDAVLEADLGSEDAEFVLDQAEGHELGWYATQELGPLLELS